MVIDPEMLKRAKIVARSFEPSAQFFRQEAAEAIAAHVQQEIERYKAGHHVTAAILEAERRGKEWGRRQTAREIRIRVSDDSFLTESWIAMEYGLEDDENGV